VDALEKKQQELEERLRAQDQLLRAGLQSQRTAPPGDATFLAPASTAERDLTAPLAGYSEKNFFIRDRNSWFVLNPKGRLNVDWYNFLNRPDPPAGVLSNSASDPRTSLRDGVFLRRARIGFAGTFVGHIDFRVESEFANLATAGQYATLTDASIVLNFIDALQLEAGQFYTPFTLENPTSENYTDFMEKAATVRFAVPTSRETGFMLLGRLPDNSLRYWVGYFDGEGQNFKNQDNKGAAIGRVIVSPFQWWRSRPSWMEDLWLGGSFWWQEADNLGGASAPVTNGAAANDLASVTTQAAFGMFSSNYANGVDAMKNAIRAHLAPDGDTAKYAFELNLPLPKRFGLRSELVHQEIDVREYNDVNPGTGNLTRSRGPQGRFRGDAAYGEVYVWIGGDVNTDKPGLYANPHWRGYVPPPPPRWAVMLAAKYEHLEFDVTGLDTVVSGKVVRDPASGEYALDVFELGGSLWVTRHSRFMANYLYNYIGAGRRRDASANETKNLFFQTGEHELLFRLAFSL
jgi:hypothetical protein